MPRCPLIRPRLLLQPAVALLGLIPLLPCSVSLPPSRAVYLPCYNIYLRLYSLMTASPPLSTSLNPTAAFLAVSATKTGCTTVRALCVLQSCTIHHRTGTFGTHQKHTKPSPMCITHYHRVCTKTCISIMTYASKDRARTGFTLPGASAALRSHALVTATRWPGHCLVTGQIYHMLCGTNKSLS